MLARTLVNDTFAGLTLAVDLGQAGFREAAIFVPALTTDTYVTVALSYDGVTYLTLEEVTNGNELDSVINSARVKVIKLGGARYIQLTAPATSQTGTVYTSVV